MNTRSPPASPSRSDPDDYDQIPYPSVPFPQTHPDRLATIATLFGLQPPVIENCRMLEIGCGTGENLLALALAFPDAEFHGIDRSNTQIATARRHAICLNAKNVRFLATDLMDYPTDGQVFDYVVAHGVYSWVPAEVREAILSLCKHVLHPEGIAYISYNTMPGWGAKSTARDFLQHYVGNIKDPSERYRQARALSRYVVDANLALDGLNALADFCLPFGDEIASASSSELTTTNLLPGYLFHEYLEQTNDAFYFHEFVDAARHHGLEFFAEANIHEMAPTGMDKSVVANLASMGNDLVAREQHLDFLRGRTFRQSLLCHEGLKVNQTIEPSRLYEMCIATSLVCSVDRPDIWGSAPLAFEIPGITIGIEQPIVKAVLLELRTRWPAACCFDEILECARNRLSTQSVWFQSRESLESDRLTVATELLQLAWTGCVELTVKAPELTRSVSERPVASPFARWRVKEGLLPVTNLRHQGVPLNELSRQLLLLLDGTHDRHALIDALTSAALSEGLVVLENGVEVSDERDIRRVVAGSLEGHLAQLADLALLLH